MTDITNPMNAGIGETNDKWLTKLIKSAEENGKNGVTTPYIFNVNLTLAEELLKRNNKNRKISPSTVNWYTKIIQKGEWEFMPEDPMAMDWDGYLRDGGHRLTAAVKANIPIRIKMEFGCDPSHYDLYDQGKRRTGKDILEIEGITNAARTTTLIRNIFSYNKNRLNFNVTKGDLSLREIAAIAKENEEQLYHSIKIIHLAEGEKLPRPALYGTVHYILHTLLDDLDDWKDSFDSYSINSIIERRKNVLDEWFYSLISNEMLSKDDTAYYLRRKLYKESMNRERRPTTEAVLTYLIKGWNAYATDDLPLTKYGYISGGSIPRLVPAKNWKHI
ncbi:MAG TPA: hypothetical protein DCG52_02845 [Alphaproteobacteria bacterium]|nr:hypothetical protein [Alphaproteobacteria bacterium]|tara:strand:+ start:1963 stop:2958 length:996 start_codon:yes stop_codon:yes gene_type:complete